MSDQPKFGVWQPIETMPKDQPVLVRSQWEGEINGIDEEYSTFIAENDCIIGGDCYAVWHKNATHWMPLPDPPTNHE